MDDETIKEWAAEIAAAGRKYYSDDDGKDTNGQQRYYECFVNDGIVCEEKWNAIKTNGTDSKKKRVLIILCEARSQIQGKCESVIDKRIYDLRQYLKNKNEQGVCEWLQNKSSTYYRVSEWLKPFIGGSKEDNIFEYVSVINLKKTPGKSKLDKARVKKFCEDFSDRLREQIIEIDPEIIIIARAIFGIFSDIMGKCDGHIAVPKRGRVTPLILHSYTHKNTAGESRTMLVFDACHPSRPYTRTKDFIDLLEEYNK